jgi:hypothetical protein
VILPFLIISLLVATIITVSALTTMEFLFPWLRSHKRRPSNVVSA